MINRTLPVCRPLTEVMSVQHYRSYEAFLLGSRSSLVVFRAIPPTACCEASVSASAAGPFRTSSRVVGSPYGAFLTKKRENKTSGGVCNVPGASFNKIKINQGAPGRLLRFLRVLAPRGVCFDGGVYYVLYGTRRTVRTFVSSVFSKSHRVRLAGLTSMDVLIPKSFPSINCPNLVEGLWGYQ